MAVAVRVRDKDPLAQFLGWFSIGVGTAQVAAPRALCRLVGADDEGLAPRVMRAMGARELTQGTSTFRCSYSSQRGTVARAPPSRSRTCSR
jgi:hypothetical protein